MTTLVLLTCPDCQEQTEHTYRRDHGAYDVVEVWECRRCGRVEVL